MDGLAKRVAKNESHSMNYVDVVYKIALSFYLSINTISYKRSSCQHRFHKTVPLLISSVPKENNLGSLNSIYLDEK